MLRAAAVVSALVAAMSCSDRPPVAPRLVPPGHSLLSLRPSFQKAPPGGPTIDLKFVEASLIGSNGETYNVHADFHGDSAILVFDVPLAAGASTFTLDVTAFDNAGQPAFHNKSSITLKPGENTPASPTLVYSAADAALTSLHVSPASLQLNAGGTSTLAVNGTASNNQPVSAIHVAWTSKDPSIATVDANGAVTASVLQGSTYIVARTYTNVADSALVKVRGNVAKVTVAPATLSIPRGGSAAVGAELRDAADHLIDDRSATWSSSNTAVATVSASGVVQAVSNGTATITATSEGRTASATVTVISPLDHITISPASLTFKSLGETQNITAQLVPVSGASVSGITAVYESSNSSVATVDANGVVTARANGSATIKASAEGKEATAAITVQQEAATLSVNPTSAGMSFIGDTRTFTATAADARGNPVATALTWSSSDESVATVNASGVATARARGTANITVSSGQKSATATLTVSQIPASMAVVLTSTTMRVGNTQQARVRITDAGGTPVPEQQSAQFSSDAPGVAAVGASGLITALSPGRATITAAAGNLTGSVVITVLPPVGNGGGGVAGTLINAQTGSPISGARIASGTLSATSAADGSFTLTGLSNGANLQIDAAGFTSTTYFNVTAGTTPTPLGALPLAPVSANVGTFSGAIIDAVTGLRVPNATIVVRSGINNTTGAVVTQTSSDQNGSYSGSLAAGTYSVAVSASGYAATTATVPSVGGVTLTNRNIVLNPSGLSNTQFRFVLQWGASPTDLDSHLVGPTGDGTNFEIAYYSRSYSQNGNVIARLDQDVTSGFGPETITLNQTVAGHYRYYVHLYCCGTSFGSATVTVFRGSQTAGQFSVPGSGSVWTVLELDGTTGAITSINTVSSQYTIPYGGSASFNVIPSRGDAVQDVTALLNRVKLHPKAIAKPSK